MLNPLNITAASGPAAGPKSDRIRPQNFDPHEAARADETFESVLAGGRGATDTPENDKILSEVTDVDSAPDTDVPDIDVPDTDVPDTDVPDIDVPDMNVPDTDEMAEFIAFPDQGTAPPDAVPSDELTQMPDAEYYSPNLVDQGSVAAKQDGLGQNIFASPDTGQGPDVTGAIPGAIAEAPHDRSSNDVASPISGRSGLRQDIRQSRALPPIQADGPKISAFQPPSEGPHTSTGHQTAANMPVMTNEIKANTPQVATGLQAPADDKSSPKGAHPAQSHLGVALNQQSSSVMAALNEALKTAPADQRALQPDPDQPLPEMARSDNPQPGLRQPSATGQTGLSFGQTGLSVLPSAEARKADQVLRNIPDQPKENSRRNDLNLAVDRVQNPPTMSTGTITAAPVTAAPVTAAPVTNLASAISNLPDSQFDTGRVSWISETGVLADTGAISDLTQPARTSLDQIFRNPDMPRHLAAQIASVAGRSGADKPVEILLNPAELGHVRIKMISVDGSMNVSVIADRPETLDLMRRHIDVLAQEFLDIGYGQAQFSFGQNSRGSGGDTDHYTPDGIPQMGGHPQETAPAAETIAATRIITDRVDIRL